MIVALIDNGSLEPAAHRNLRKVARDISKRAGIDLVAVSWKHSDRIRPASLEGERAWTLRRFVTDQFVRGERQFIFVPFFINAQGAIGSALRDDLVELQRTLGEFEFTFTEGLAARRALPFIVASRIRETIAAEALARPAVIVVDHGGPSVESAHLRNELAAQIDRLLGTTVAAVSAASLEGADYPHNHPLFADLLVTPGFNRGDVVVAPLFLAPGRHAGPRGDLAQIASAAEDRVAAAGLGGAGALRCHFTALVGTHPLVIDALTDALLPTLATLHAQPFA